MNKRIRFFWWLLIGISLGLAYFLVIGDAFPYLGISLTMITLATAALDSKKPTIRTGWEYYGLIVILSLFITLRANPLLLFLDFIAILLFGALLILRLYPERTVSQFLFAPFNAIAHWFFIKPVMSWSTLLSSLGLGNGQGKWQNWAGIAITFILLLITLPALGAANPIFAQWLQRLNPHIHETTILWLVRAGLASLFIWLIPKLIAASRKRHLHSSPIKTSPISWWIPQLVIAVLLGVFFIGQWQLYTFSESALTATGISHSQRTREVFGQLIWVALVTLGLMWIKPQPRFRWLRYVLLLEGLALTGFALQSDWAYIQAWGFTQKRLWGLALLVWLWALYVLIIKTKPLWILAVVSGWILVFINFCNFDYLISTTQPAANGQGIDYVYLSQLSFDAANLGSLIRYEEASVAPYTKENVPSSSYFLLRQSFGRATYLKNQYEPLDIRAFNLGEYRSYKSLEGIDLDLIKAKLTELEP